MMRAVCSARIERGQITQRVASVGPPTREARDMMRHAQRVKDDHDASVKRSRLANVVLGISVKPVDIDRADWIVRQLKQSGMNAASRSGVVRWALERLASDIINGMALPSGAQSSKFDQHEEDKEGEGGARAPRVKRSPRASSARAMRAVQEAHVDQQAHEAQVSDVPQAPEDGLREKEASDVSAKRCDACRGDEAPAVLCAAHALDPRPIPAVDNSLPARRRLALSRQPELHEDTVFTCDDCPSAIQCRMAFDSYNVNGDCLADK